MYQVEKAATVIGSVGAILIASMGLLGYLPGFELLGSVNEDYIPMAPSTAISFLCLGSVLLKYSLNNNSTSKLYIYISVSFIVSLFGLLEVVGYYTDLDLNFENLIVPDVGHLNGVPIARMSPSTGALFFLSGVASIFFFLRRNIFKTSQLNRYLHEGLGLVILLISFVFCLAYLYGTPLLYGHGTTIPMALTTALGFLLLSTSILTANKNSFVIKVFSENSTRNILLRFLLPFSTASVVIGGIAPLLFQNDISANPAFVSASLTVLVVIAAAFLASYMSTYIGNTIDLLNIAAKKTEQALEESQEQQRSLLNHTSSIIYIKDLDGKYTFINRRYQILFNISNEEIKGKTDYDLFPSEAADKFLANDLQAMTANESLEFEETIPQDDGPHTYLSVKSPLKNLSGKIYAICGFSTDITERKQLEHQLRQTQRMDAIGQLTGGVAHDFNNILGIVLGNIELAKSKAGENQEIQKYLDKAYKGGRRGAEITRKLLMFSRQGPSNPKAVNLGDLVQGMESLIHKSLTPKITIETKVSSDLWKTKIDPGDFEDAILNLSLNARDAMPNGGALIIEAVNKVLDDQYALRNPEGAAGEYVMLMFSDTGAGMPQEVIDKAFQPFFSTKEQSKGTGLGLSMVYGFVQRSGGHVKIYSELGRGTTFRLYFPRATDQVAGNGDAALAVVEEPPHGTETILVVDDEKQLLDVAVSFLESLDYMVIKASNGKQALEILKDQSHQIDLVFSDVVMPGGIDGYDLCLETLKTYPRIKVLLTSGFTSKREDAVNGDRPLLAELSKNLLNKPYNRAELADAARQILDKDS